MDEFRRKILKVDGPRKHKISNSFGVYDAYKLIRKNKWFGIGGPISEHDFYSIIRTVNNLLADFLSKGHDVNLPCQMGRLEIRKYDAKITLQEGKIFTNLPIDWDKTLKLWSEDEDAYQERTLVKMEEKEIFKVYYNRGKANYTNKSFFAFDVNRELKKKLKKNIKERRIDAYKLND
nr:MAG TPA: DNA-binding protein [Bacteriophage sp.]